MRASCNRSGLELLIMSDDNEDDRLLDGEEDALTERLRKIEVPKASVIPLPPEVTYSRPGSSQPTEQLRPGADRTNVTIGADRPRHLSPSQSSSFSDNAGSVGSAMGAGLTFAASVVVGYLVGAFVDSHFHWNRSGIPWGVIVFVFAGLAAGFVNLFRLLAIGERSGKGKR